MLDLLGTNDARIYVCPHIDTGTCPCRKPRPGMLFSAMKDAGVVAGDTLFVGDMVTDEQAARNADVAFTYAKDFFDENQE